jgi:hypothetical protein
MVEIAAKCPGHMRKIAFMHLDRDAVASGVLAGKIGITGLQFQPGQHQSRHPHPRQSAAAPAPQPRSSTLCAGSAGQAAASKTGSVAAR